MSPLTLSHCPGPARPDGSAAPRAATYSAAAWLCTHHDSLCFPAAGSAEIAERHFRSLAFEKRALESRETGSRIDAQRLLSEKPANFSRFNLSCEARAVAGHHRSSADRQPTPGGVLLPLPPAPTTSSAEHAFGASKHYQNEAGQHRQLLRAQRRGRAEDWRHQGRACKAGHGSQASGRRRRRRQQEPGSQGVSCQASGASVSCVLVSLVPAPPLGSDTFDTACTAARQGGGGRQPQAEAAEAQRRRGRQSGRGGALPRLLSHALWRHLAARLSVSHLPIGTLSPRVRPFA